MAPLLGKDGGEPVVSRARVLEIGGWTGLFCFCSISMSAPRPCEPQTHSPPALVTESSSLVGLSSQRVPRR